MNQAIFWQSTAKPHTLEELRAGVISCTNCPLYATRHLPVIGEGDPEAKIVLIGEAPGEQEDLSGRAFVGPAGQLLTKILAAIHLKREQVYLTNILKCRPPNNRTPTQAEIASCAPWLQGQMELIAPKLILCLGKVAANTLLNNNESLSRLRGMVHHAFGAQVVVTYHPAALLRNPGWKRGCWEDIKAFRRLFDALGGTSC